MKALAFLKLQLHEQIAQLAKWEAGHEKDNLRTFVLSFLDDVVFPFKQGSGAEKWSDTVLGLIGPAGYPMLEEHVLKLVGATVHARPTERLAVFLEELHTVEADPDYAGPGSPGGP